MNNRPKIISLTVTAVIAAAVVLLLINGHLSVDRHQQKKWPPEKNFELIAENIEEPESFVSTYSSQADDIWEPQAEADDPGASDNDSDTPTATSHDLTTEGNAEGHDSKLTSTTKESDLKQKKEAKQGTTKPDDAAKLQAQREQRSKKNINDKLKNKFSGKGSGEGGKSDSKADGTKDNNGPGGNEPLSYSASINERPQSNELGWIKISVVVVEGGKVRPGSAEFHSGYGNAGKNAALRKDCLNRAYKCQFKRASNDTSPRTGIITFKWEDKKR